MKNIKQIFIALLVLSHIPILSQNIVENGSFEVRDSVYQESYQDYYNCPWSCDDGPNGYNKQLPMAKGWSNPDGIYNNEFYSSSDFFHACGWDTSQTPYGIQSTSVGTPKNYWLGGYQVPRTGKGYAGSIVYSANNPYYSIDPGEFIQSKLKFQLQAGVTYKAVYYVSLINFCSRAIKAHGIYFSPGKPDMTELCTGIDNGSIQPQVMNQNGYLTDTVNWTKIEGAFIADGDEEYLSIGNFDVRKGVSKYLYFNYYFFAAYLVEDIALFPVDAPVEPANCGNDTLICLGESIRIGKTEVEEQYKDEYHFEWFILGKEDSIVSNEEHPVFTPDTSTTYIVRLTDFKFDKSSDTITVSVVDCQAPTSLIVYPNPTEDMITFRLNSPIPKGMMLELFDVTGRRMEAISLMQNYELKEFTVDLRKYATGVYFYRINISDEPKFCGKIIKV